jgi:hypothetical protein
MGGDPSNSMGGSRGDNAQKEQVGVLQKIRDSAKGQAEGMKNQPRWWTKALKTMGIQMGIAGILKQSQIFTSTLGSLFQILGAFVDVMLAPWMPVIIPALRKLANQIPAMRVAAQKFFDWTMALPWGTLKTLGKWLANATSSTWWTNIINTGIEKIQDWLGEKIGDPVGTALGALGTLINVDLLGLGEKVGGVFTSVGDKLGLSVDAVGGLVAKTTAAVGLLAATWTAAKLARYGLQATRWIPFVNKFTEPVRILGKGIDLLFNRTAQAIGKGFAGLSKGLFSKLQSLFGKKPVVPKVPKGPRKLGRFGLGQADILDDIPGGGGRGTGRGGGGGGRGGRGGDIDDTWRAKTKGPNLKAYGEGYDQIDFGKGKGATAGGIAQEAGDSLGKPAKSSKVGKAILQFKRFKDWLGSSVPAIMKASSKGNMGKVKGLVQKGMTLAATTLKMAMGTPIGRIAARAAVGFLKILPFLGAAYMGMETHYDLKKIEESDKAWTGDMGSVGAWMKEGKGFLASILGEGKLGKFSPLAGLSKVVHDTGKLFGKDVMSPEMLKRWKDSQAEGGALSSGKALDYGIRGITGYGGAAASFLPLLGQIVGGATYEAGKYTSMGQFMDMEMTGTAKYGEGSFAEASIDKIMQMFNGMAINIGVDGAPANAAMGGEHNM